jgi:hypothetical protein
MLSALTPKADIDRRLGNVRLVPKVEIAAPSSATENWDSFHCKLPAGSGEIQYAEPSRISLLACRQFPSR